ncbi:MAG TPA: phage tail tip lysozyme [Verrucomicrobiae bacterium]|nr:phage tail tip lysozyme [Verrucomicrobiae bacterium]
MLILGQVAAVNALPPGQQEIFDEGINYFDLTTTCDTSGDTPSTPSSTNGASSLTALTGDQKISGTFMLGFDAGTPKPTIESVFKQYKPGGIFVLGTKDAAAAGFNKAFFEQLAQDAGHKIVAASDEEGGQIHRYGYGFSLPSPHDMSSMSDADVQSLGKQVGQAMASSGLNTDLAPVLDVSTDSSGTDTGVTGRAFSNDPGVVAAKGGAFATGLQSAGINPVYKHFPGLGSSSGNTDNQPVTSPSLSQLESHDLKPYESIVNKNGAAVMLDNAHIPGLTASGEVASTSAPAINLLRNKYNFNGLIMTDDLTATGVQLPLASAVAKALQAGVDMPIFTYSSNGQLDAAISAAKAAGINTDKALQNIDNFLAHTANTGGSTQMNSCCGGGSTTLVGNTNAEKVWNFFIGKGLTNVQVAAIMGNLQQESGFSPTIVNSGSGAYGLGQWLGGRLTALKGQPNYTDLGTQLDFMWSELNGSYKSSVLDPLKQATDLKTAVNIWLIHYEAPCTEGSSACTIELTKRFGFAIAWINHANGGNGSGSAATSSETSDSCSSGSSGSGNYTNPFHDMSNLGASRIDEGVDYYAKSGSVPIYAIGNGKVTLATDHSSFYTTSGGHADWITYQLTDGPATGKYIYVAEACPPSVHTGDVVTSNTVLCNVLPDSIETGWASDATTQIAAAHDVYREGYETAYGVNFNQLLEKLGAPGGHLDTSHDPGGTVLGSLPANWPQW